LWFSKIAFNYPHPLVVNLLSSTTITKDADDDDGDDDEDEHYNDNT